MKSLMEAATGITQEKLFRALEKRNINPDPERTEIFPFAKPAYLVTEKGEKILLSDLREVQP